MNLHLKVFFKLRPLTGTRAAGVVFKLSNQYFFRFQSESISVLASNQCHCWQRKLRRPDPSLSCLLFRHYRQPQFTCIFANISCSLPQIPPFPGDPWFTFHLYSTGLYFRHRGAEEEEYQTTLLDQQGR